MLRYLSATPPRSQSLPPKVPGHSCKILVTFPKVPDHSPKVWASPPRSQTTPPKVPATSPKVPGHSLKVAGLLLQGPCTSVDQEPTWVNTSSSLSRKANSRGVPHLGHPEPASSTWIWDWQILNSELGTVLSFNAWNKDLFL